MPEVACGWIGYDGGTQLVDACLWGRLVLMRCAALLHRGGDFDWERLREAGVDEIAEQLADTAGEFDLAAELERVLEEDEEDELVTEAELKAVAEAVKKGTMRSQDWEDAAALLLGSLGLKLDHYMCSTAPQPSTGSASWKPLPTLSSSFTAAPRF
jgi:hypothetical protein